MKKRFSEEQIIGFLREAENTRLKKLLSSQLRPAQAHEGAMLLALRIQLGLLLSRRS
jgi:hypothetical protein